MRRTIRLALTTLLAGSMGTAILAVARPTSAAEAGAMSATGACKGDSEWSLTANQDIGLEFEMGIESGVANQTWHFAMYYNNFLVFKGNQVTDADGGFEFKQQTANRVGIDALRIHAQNLVTGEECEGGLQGDLGVG